MHFYVLITLSYQTKKDIDQNIEIKRRRHAGSVDTLCKDLLMSCTNGKHVHNMFT